MRNDTHQRVDSKTSYNWTSITKTTTAIALLHSGAGLSLTLGQSELKLAPAR